MKSQQLEKHMDAKLYEIRRNELIGLIDETLAVDIPEPHRGTLRHIRKKCQENQFEIALIGEFQGGKSTTFNTLCDGREISPRGLGGGGIKTSAAIVTAQHISDPTETRDGHSEWAEVNWRTSYDIVLGIAEVVHRHLLEEPMLQELLNPQMPSEMIAARMDLSNSDHKEALEKAVDMEWQTWERCKAEYPGDRLDLLRIAWLQLQHLDKQPWRALTARNVLSIQEFQKVITFPRNWAAAWADGPKGLVKEFDLETVGFVFVSDVLVRIRAENLARTGCRITDCPGLFASKWDTNLARGVMNRADGLWYLLDGRRQMGDGDTKAMRFIQENGWTEKLRASVNLRGNSHEQIIESIIPVNQAILSTLGLAEVNLIPYDARLAFLANQGKLLLERPERFEEYDRHCMAVDYNRKVPVPELDSDAAWCNLVKRQASGACIAELEDIPSLDASSVKAVRQASRIDDLLDSLEKDVITSKARSILVDNGSRAAAKALERYEGDLKAREEACEQKVEEFKREVAAAREEISVFSTDVQEMIDDSVLGKEIDPVDGYLAEEFVNAIFSQRLFDRVAELSVDTVHRLHGELFVSKKQFSNEVNRALSSALSEAYKDRQRAVLNEWKKGRTPPFYQHIVGPQRQLWKKICNRWEKIPQTLVIAGIPLPDPPAPTTFGDVTYNTIVEKLAGDISEYFESFLIVLICAIPLPFIYLYDFVDDLFLSEDERRDRETEQKRKKERKLQEKKRELSQICRDVIEGDYDTRKKLIEGYRIYFCNFRASSKNGFEEGIKDVKKQFEKRASGLEGVFLHSNAEREKLAQEANFLRLNTIGPIRQRIESFEMKANSELKPLVDAVDATQ